MYNSQFYGYGYQPQQNSPNVYESRLNDLQGVSKPRYEIIQVNGENGAEMLPMGQRSNVIALDQSRKDILLAWFIQTDDAGYKTKTPYILTPYIEKSPQNNFEERLSRLEAIINDKQSVNEYDAEPKSEPKNKSKSAK